MLSEEMEKIIEEYRTKVGFEIFNKLKSGVPVATGRLRDSLKLFEADEEITIESELNYAKKVAEPIAEQILEDTDYQQILDDMQ